MTHTNKESRLLHLGPEFLGAINAVGKSGILDGLAKLEGAGQPARVAREYAEASKEIAKMNNEKDKFMKASDVLFQIYYGQNQKTEKTEVNTDANTIPKPETELLSVVKQLGCRMLLQSFQKDMENALSTGDPQHLQLAAQKLDMLQQLMSLGEKKAQRLNKQYPMGNLGVADFAGGSFGVDDQLNLILGNLTNQQWDGRSAVEGSGAFAGKKLLVQKNTDGTFALKPAVEDYSNNVDYVALRQQEAECKTMLKQTRGNKKNSNEGHFMDSPDYWQRRLAQVQATLKAKYPNASSEKEEMKKEDKGEVYRMIMELKLLKETIGHEGYQKDSKGLGIMEKNPAVEALEDKIKAAIHLRGDE